MIKKKNDKRLNVFIVAKISFKGNKTDGKQQKMRNK